MLNANGNFEGFLRQPPACRQAGRIYKLDRINPHPKQILHFIQNDRYPKTDPSPSASLRIRMIPLLSF